MRRSQESGGVRSQEESGEVTEEESGVIRSEEEESGVYIVWRRGMERNEGRRKGRRLTGKKHCEFFLE